MLLTWMMLQVRMFLARVYGELPPSKWLNSGTQTLMLALIVLSLTACSPAPDESSGEAPRRRVAVEPVTISERSEQFTVSGRVEHTHEALLSFKGGGLVADMYVDEGDRFAEGDLLAALDTTEIAAAYTDAKQQLEKAQRDVRRFEQLYNEEAISLQNLQDARTGLERAQAGERRARFVLDNALIHAPFDGFVAYRNANVGELIGEGTPVLRVVEDGSQRLIRVGVPSRLLPWLGVGDEASVDVENIGETLSATITRIGAVAERGTGNFIVELELETHQLLREGLVATVTLSGPPREVIVLPGGALSGGDEDRGLFYIVRNDTALQRELHIYRMTGDSIFAEAGLPEGTPVIVRGSGFLSDGEAVDAIGLAEWNR